jgi:oligopeptide/dipeptide ABC transporter ATP-binding protein
MGASVNLLELQNLSVVFHTEEGLVQAVQDLSLNVRSGGVLGLVGESGCGKSVTAFSILNLVSPGLISGGRIIFAGSNLLALPEKDMRAIRGNRIAIIPQDPLTSLNPVYTVGAQIMEAIELHQHVGRGEARKRAIAMLERVQVPEAAARVDDYPHQFSGGMRQRAMIAMALTCKPSLLIADEPTTALDVTVQAQILNLLRELQAAEGMSIMLITHDLGVVAELCDELAVMYAGSIVEQGTTRAVFAHPRMPYTQGLLKSIPRPGVSRLQSIEGTPPALIDLPQQCRFAPRCPLVHAQCREGIPPLEEKHPGHFVRCVLDEVETDTRDTCR